MIEARCRAGDVLHLWLMAAPQATAAAVVTVEAAEAVPVRLEVDGSSEDYLRRSFRVARDGPVVLTWDPAATRVSLAYAFDPATVTQDGVRLLWVDDRCHRVEPGPMFHFRPPWGWMNDPNGLCRTGDTVHLFYQHYPHARMWNTMHWGHAVSRDLVTWIHLPVFLLPREELTRDAGRRGGAFSGSAIPLGNGPGLRVFFTDREDTRLPEWEWQMTAASPDCLAAGEPDPVIDRRPDLPGYRQDFRDPYVLRGPDGRWKMLLAGRDQTAALILIYETEDKDAAGGWRFLGVLHREVELGPGPAECPCLVPLADGLWVLMFGVLGSREADGRRNLSLALTGRFDGRGFAAIDRHELDLGTAAYAFQAFTDADGPVAIAWAANWTEMIKGAEFPSAMTLMRRLEWRGDHLATPPVAAVETLRDRALPSLPSHGPAPLGEGLAELVLKLVRPGAPFRLVLDVPGEPVSVIGHHDGLELVHGDPQGEWRYRQVGSAFTDLRLFVDRGLVELYLDGGRWCWTRRLRCWQPARSIHLEIAAADVAHEQLWRLRPIAAGLVDLTTAARLS